MWAQVSTRHYQHPRNPPYDLGVRHLKLMILLFIGWFLEGSGLETSFVILAQYCVHPPHTRGRRKAGMLEELNVLSAWSPVQTWTHDPQTYKSQL